MSCPCACTLDEERSDVVSPCGAHVAWARRLHLSEAGELAAEVKRLRVDLEQANREQERMSLTAVLETLKEDGVEDMRDWAKSRIRWCNEKLTGKTAP